MGLDRRALRRGLAHTLNQLHARGEVDGLAKAGALEPRLADLRRQLDASLAAFDRR